VLQPYHVASLAFDRCRVCTDSNSGVQITAINRKWQAVTPTLKML